MTPSAIGPVPTTPPRWTMPALLGFVCLTLAVLLVVPFWLDARVDAIRAQINAEVDHAAERSNRLEREAALAAAAARGYVASGDTLFARDFADSDRAVVDALTALGAVAATLGEGLPRAVERVEEAWGEWSRPVRLLVQGEVDLITGVQALPLSQARYETVIHNAGGLRNAIRMAAVVRMERIRVLEQTRREVTFALVPLALLAAVAVFWLGRRLHTQAEALAAREAELRALAVDLERRVATRTREVRRLSVAVVETERREQARIAQLLHDHLQQLLYGARMRLGFLDASDEDVRAVDGILGDAIQATRTLAVELSPPVLREEGLPAALGWLGEHVERVNGLRVAVEADGAAARAARHVQDLLFQLARELLFNVVKHAGVDEAALTLRCRPAPAGGHTITLVVADGGEGFDPAATPDGYGLGSVRERVALVEGTLHVASYPGRGTTVTVTVPAPEPEPAEAIALPVRSLSKALVR